MNYMNISRADFVRENTASYHEAFDYDLARVAVGGGDADKLLMEIQTGADISIPESDKALFMAGLELGKRYAKPHGPVISNPADVYKAVRRFWNPEQEVFAVVSLNAAHQVISSDIVSIGILNRTIIHPREVYAGPLRMRAAAIAVAHNHPSGSVNPSDDDCKVTARLANAGEILGIKLLDHIVFTDDCYYSFLEHGRI